MKTIGYRFMTMKKSLISILLIFVLLSCDQEPQSGLLARYMAVQTQYDQTVVNSSSNIFTSYSTFIIRNDTIGFVSTSSTDTVLVDGVNINVPNGYVKPVVNLIRSKISAAGFTEVTENDNPDFAINTAVLQNFSFFQTVNYPGYYSGYYGYYNYYYPIITTHYSNYATLVIEIVDIKNYATFGNKYKIIWKASIGDLIATDDLRGKTLEAIDQAFLQSTFIKKN